ncbi:MAG: ABC transporter ATP-binding protein [Candidatus Abyssobacteria bacterium SURF_5]|uniref:ABC transporter ATP-binding protein n=1 Tax=Abyssobacteria bacterium (strain SURF_5) TaxID=2093360 RepID=A0A3A4MUP5_ABYX5|nr:MAG: ABC transporter ATP-binding protein [Candidatus Abyssubacteria bacterium SURF_5]
MSALVLKSLTKVFDNKVVALDRVCLEVDEGELLVILGPSGSGKSTILRLIAGLDKPSSGEIFIGGKPATHTPPRERDIAMVFQDYALYPHFNVAQNLGFGLKMRRVPKSEIQARVLETARMLGIDGLLERKPKELSGGQRQRVALGRALVRKPKVFLFDEPLSNLDPALRVQLRQEIKQIHDALGATVVYVTHDQHEAMLIGRRVAILRAGVLEQVGTPSDLYCRPGNLFVAGFLGTPPINFVECRAEMKNGRTELVCGNDEGKKFQLDVSPVPPRISLAFRPEDVLLGNAGENASLSGTALVHLIEPMAGETVIHLEDGSISFCARSLGFLDLAPGSRVAYSIPQDKLLLFEEGTGKRIGSQNIS